LSWPTRSTGSSVFRYPVAHFVVEGATGRDIMAVSRAIEGKTFGKARLARAGTAENENRRRFAGHGSMPAGKNGKNTATALVQREAQAAG